MKKSLILLLCIITIQSTAQPVAQATRFLESMRNGKVQLIYPMNHAERFNFKFVPLDRMGPTFHDMNEQQSAYGLSLLKSSVSNTGYEKITSIIALENVLRVVENRSPLDLFRDPKNYHFLVFGTPGNGAWGWKFEGHHISWNFAFNGDQLVSSTPTFLGSNPGIVQSGSERGKQVLKQETDLGFQLVISLSAEQLQVARFSEKALPEIVSFDKKKAEALSPAGITFRSLNASQQKIFLDLLATYMKNYEFGFSERLMERIKKAGIDNLTFAWAGSLAPGAGHYYRIQGPMLLIEYDNTQNNANHVHSVVRDLENDFAEDILREHYAKEHSR